MTCSRVVACALVVWGAVACTTDGDDAVRDVAVDAVEEAGVDLGDADAPPDAVGDVTDADLTDDAADLVPEDIQEDVGPDGSDAGETDEPPICVDQDGDGRGPGCGPGADCDDSDGDNWASCGSCGDADRDEVFAGCDRYTVLSGPDCDDGDGFVFRQAETYTDADFDTYGEDEAATTCVALHPPVGRALVGGDCNDRSAVIHPGAVELPGDGFDNDCAGGDGPVTDDAGVFAVGGADAYCLGGSEEGERGCPFTDLQDAADAAADMAGVVFMAEGDFGPVETEVSLFGGFRVGTVDTTPPDWARAGDAQTRIAMSDGVGIRVLGGPVLLHGLTVVGEAAPDGAVGIESTATDLTLVNVDVSVITSDGDATGLRSEPGGEGSLRVLGSTFEVVAAADGIGIHQIDGLGLIDGTAIVVATEGTATGLAIQADGPVAIRTLDVGSSGASAVGLSVESGDALLIEDCTLEVASLSEPAVGLEMQSEADATQHLRGNRLTVGGPSAVGLRHQGDGPIELRHNQFLTRGVSLEATGISNDTARIRLLNNVVFTRAVTAQLLLASGGPTEVAANNLRLQGDVSGRAEVFWLTGEWALVANTIAVVDDGTGDPPRVFVATEAAQSLRVMNAIFDVRADTELAPGVNDVAAFNACEWDGCSAAGSNLRTDARLTLDGLDVEDHGPPIDAGIDLTTLAIGVSESAPLLDIRGAPRPVDGHDPEGDGSSDTLAEWDIGARELPGH